MLDLSERTYEINQLGYDTDDIKTVLSQIEDRYDHFLRHDEIIEKIALSSVKPNSPKPAKIIGKHLSENGFSIPDADKESIGSMFSAILRRLTYTLRLTHGCEGNAEDYYHRGSCWWGGYSESREYLTRANGGAFRAYDEWNNLIGRIWYIPVENGLILFNSYGKNDLQHTHTWARDVATMLKTKYRSVRVYWSFEGSFYANDQTYYYVGDDAKEQIEFRIALPEPITYTCDYCGRRYRDENELIHYHTGNNYCVYCMTENFCIPEGETDLWCIDDCIRIHRQLRRVYYLRNHPDLVQTVDHTWIHRDDALYDVYGNAHRNQLDRFGATCFVDEITEEIYPVTERIFLTSGYVIARSNYDPSIHTIQTPYNRPRSHTFQLWY